jgi:hypothetical protein
MPSNGVLASQREAIIENIFDDLTAIRLLVEDIDEWADHPDSEPRIAAWLLALLQGKTILLLEDLGKAFREIKNPS